MKVCRPHRFEISSAKSFKAQAGSLYFLLRKGRRKTNRTRTPKQRREGKQRVSDRSSLLKGAVGKREMGGTNIGTVQRTLGIAIPSFIPTFCLWHVGNRSISGPKNCPSLPKIASLPVFACANCHLLYSGMHRHHARY